MRLKDRISCMALPVPTPDLGANTCYNPLQPHSDFEGGTDRQSYGKTGAETVR